MLQAPRAFGLGTSAKSDFEMKRGACFRSFDATKGRLGNFRLRVLPAPLGPDDWLTDWMNVGVFGRRNRRLDSGDRKIGFDWSVNLWNHVRDTHSTVKRGHCEKVVHALGGMKHVKTVQRKRCQMDARVATMRAIVVSRGSKRVKVKAKGSVADAHRHWLEIRLFILCLLISQVPDSDGKLATMEKRRKAGLKVCAQDADE